MERGPVSQEVRDNDFKRILVSSAVIAAMDVAPYFNFPRVVNSEYDVPIAVASVLLIAISAIQLTGINKNFHR